MSNAKIPWRKRVKKSNPKSWKHLIGDAPDPGTKIGPEPLKPGPATTYGDDQKKQLAQKLKAAEEVLLRTNAASIARAIIEKRYHQVDFELEERVAPKLAILLGPDGQERRGDWLVPELARVEASRIKKWEKRQNTAGEDCYSPRAIVRSWKSSSGKVVLTGTRRDEWSFGLGPKYSYGLCLAADEGHPDVVRGFLLTLTKRFLPVFRRATNDPYLVANACHIKPWNIHQQTTWSLWSDPEPDPAGKRKDMCCMPVGGADVPNRMYSTVSLSTIGQLHQQAMGLDLKKLTGREDALPRAQFFLEQASRHQSPLNYVLVRWVRLYAAHLLGKEEWAPLRPFIARGLAEYERRKAEQLGEADAQSDLMAAAAERQRLQRLLDDGETQHAESLRLAAAKMEELEKAAEDRQKAADAKVHRAEKDVSELVEEIQNREVLHAETVDDLKESVELAEQAREDAVEREREATIEAENARAKAEAVVGEVASAKAEAAAAKAALAEVEGKVQALTVMEKRAEATAVRLSPQLLDACRYIFPPPGERKRSAALIPPWTAREEAIATAREEAYRRFFEPNPDTASGAALLPEYDFVFASLAVQAGAGPVGAVRAQLRKIMAPAFKPGEILKIYGDVVGAVESGKQPAPENVCEDMVVRLDAFVHSGAFKFNQGLTVGIPYNLSLGAAGGPDEEVPSVEGMEIEVAAKVLAAIGKLRVPPYTVAAARVAHKAIKDLHRAGKLGKNVEVFPDQTRRVEVPAKAAGAKAAVGGIDPPRQGGGSKPAGPEPS